LMAENRPRENQQI